MIERERTLFSGVTFQLKLDGSNRASWEKQPKTKGTAFLGDLRLGLFKAPRCRHDVSKGVRR